MIISSWCSIHSCYLIFVPGRKCQGQEIARLKHKVAQQETELKAQAAKHDREMEAQASDLNSKFESELATQVAKHDRDMATQATDYNNKLATASAQHTAEIRDVAANLQKLKQGLYSFNLNASLKLSLNI